MKSNRTTYPRVPVVASLYVQLFVHCGSLQSYHDHEDRVAITDIMITAMTTNLITRMLMMMTIAGMMALTIVIPTLPMAKIVMMMIVVMTMMTKIAQLGEMSIGVNFFHTLPSLTCLYTCVRYFLRAD